MNNIYSTSLKLARKLNSILEPENRNFGRNKNIYPNKEYSNRLIFELLNNNNSCMIGRFGATEMLCLSNYIGTKKISNPSYLKFIKGEIPPWWWEMNSIKQLELWSGFFPPKIESVEKFCELMIEDMKELDILGSWLNEEFFFQKELKNVRQVSLEDLEPFFVNNPWTKALEGKKVLVVHPFAKTIESQFKKRKLLFENDLLPDFELITIEAVQSIAGAQTKFKDWFEALEHMKNQIEKCNFDIAIIGCGAYGFPLAAQTKRLGKKAFHLAGVTQLLFGIKGSRWEKFHYYPYMNLFNKNWVRPGHHEIPQNAEVVENACYW